MTNLPISPPRKSHQEMTPSIKLQMQPRPCSRTRQRGADALMGMLLQTTTLQILQIHPEPLACTSYSTCSVNHADCFGTL